MKCNEHRAYKRELWDLWGDLVSLGASMVSQTVKSLPAIQNTRIQSLSWEDPLEKGMATLSNIPLTEEPGELQSIRSQTVGHD